LLEEAEAPQALLPTISSPLEEPQVNVEEQEAQVPVETLKPEAPVIRLSPEDMELLKQEQMASSHNTSPIPLTFGGVPYGTAVRTIGKLLENINLNFIFCR
jgi:hypothetical protein